MTKFVFIYIICVLTLRLGHTGLDLIKVFLEKDFAGKRVNSLNGQDPYFEEVILWGEIPEFDTYTVVREFKENVISQNDTIVVVLVTYQKIGIIEFSQPLRTFVPWQEQEEVTITALLIDGNWKIIGSQIDPHVDASIVLEKEMLDEKSKKLLARSHK